MNQRQPATEVLTAIAARPVLSRDERDWFMAVVFLSRALIEAFDEDDALRSLYVSNPDSGQPAVPLSCLETVHLVRGILKETLAKAPCSSATSH
jgi:hypothetical protein